MKKRLLVFPIIMFVLFACSPTVQASLPTDTGQPTFASIVTETPASSVSTGACPSETADLKLFINADDGYCLLYPAEDAPNPPYLIIIHPNGMPGDVPGDA